MIENWINAAFYYGLRSEILTRDFLPRKLRKPARWELAGHREVGKVAFG